MSPQMHLQPRGAYKDAAAAAQIIVFVVRLRCCRRRRLRLWKPTAVNKSACNAAPLQHFIEPRRVGPAWVNYNCSCCDASNLMRQTKKQCATRAILWRIIALVSTILVGKFSMFWHYYAHAPRLFETAIESSIGRNDGVGRHFNARAQSEEQLHGHFLQGRQINQMCKLSNFIYYLTPLSWVFIISKKFN